jgi:hypothetical protein
MENNMDMVSAEDETNLGDLMMKSMKRVDRIMISIKGPRMRTESQ